MSRWIFYCVECEWFCTVLRWWWPWNKRSVGEVSFRRLNLYQMRYWPRDGNLCARRRVSTKLFVTWIQFEKCSVTLVQKCIECSDGNYLDERVCVRSDFWWSTCFESGNECLLCEKGEFIKFGIEFYFEEGNCDMDGWIRVLIMRRDINKSNMKNCTSKRFNCWCFVWWSCLEEITNACKPFGKEHVCLNIHEGWGLARDTCVDCDISDSNCWFQQRICMFDLCFVCLTENFWKQNSKERGENNNVKWRRMIEV